MSIQLPLLFPSEYVEIKLSKRGKYSGMYQATVDSIDGFLGERNWKIRLHDGRSYAARNIQVNKKAQVEYLHRVIMARKLGRPLVKGELVDHINGNGLDNRRENLRLATTSQNNQNSRLPRTNTSGYKGVYWEKKRAKWHAQITINNICIFLGRFEDKEIAYQAYCEAAIKYHGEFANFGVAA